MVWTPWQFIAVAVAGRMNRQQQEVIDYLREENRILREKLGGKRLLLNAEQKHRLAVKGKALGRQLLKQFGTLFSPDTILRWHRMLIARKYDGSAHRGKPGPAPTQADMIRKLVLQMAEQNPSYGPKTHPIVQSDQWHVCFSDLRGAREAQRTLRRGTPPCHSALPACLHPPSPGGPLQAARW